MKPAIMVDIFRRSADVLPIAQSEIRIGAKCPWQQLGVMILEAAALARFTRPEVRAAGHRIPLHRTYRDVPPGEFRRWRLNRRRDFLAEDWF